MLQNLSVLIVDVRSFLMEHCHKAEVLCSAFIMLTFILWFITESFHEKSFGFIEMKIQIIFNISEVNFSINFASQEVLSFCFSFCQKEMLKNKTATQNTSSKIWLSVTHTETEITVFLSSPVYPFYLMFLIELRFSSRIGTGWADFSVCSNEAHVGTRSFYLQSFLHFWVHLSYFLCLSSITT